MELVASVPENKPYNKLGSAVNRIMCYYENIILQHAIHIINVKGMEIAILMFDGLMVYGNYYKDKGYSVIVWGVIPGGLSGGGAHPNYALPENRNRASKLMNELFYKKCNELNIEFISIWEDLIKIDNYYDYFIDSIHLSYSACKSLLYLKFKDYING